MTPWRLACPDWVERLRTGRSLVPDLPGLDLVAGNRAVAIFNKLRLADVPGTPTMEEASGDWFRDIVRAMFGSYDRVNERRMIRELFALVPKKNSKALALDTLIATPAGFTTMRDVQVGDRVLAVDGTPATVTAKSEVFEWHDCYEVEFSTGEKVVCDAEHLWVTDAHADRDKRPRYQRCAPRPTAKTTAEIAACVKVPSGKFLISNHRTALCGALQLPEAKLPIPPYVLGAWLGDGHTDGAVITAGRADAGHMVDAITATGHSARIMGYDSRTDAARISIAEPGNAAEKLPYRFRTEAVALGVMGAKHVPQIYLRGSFEQRLQLLRGLMDTDGSMSLAGQANYSTTTPRLRDGVVELVNSLGLKASVSEQRAKLGDKDCGPVWIVQFWPFNELEVFSLQRKLKRQRASVARNSARSRSRQIVAVRRVASVPTQCISVSSETKQFLVTRSLIPTHNTTNGALLMLTALLLNERPRAPMGMAAPVQDVAEIAFNAIAGAIALDPVLEKKLHVRDHLKTIVHRETKATLEVMTFDPAALTGPKWAAFLLDEVHQIAKASKAAKAFRQIKGGMLPYPEAFLAQITTQSDDPPVGIFESELRKARAIRDGKIEGAMLPVLYEFPEEMQKDPEVWRNPANWPMVTPNLGRSVQLHSLVDGMKDAEQTSDAELRAWASQHLNVQIGLALKGDSWAGALFWEQQGDRALTLDGLLARSEVVTVGIDGGGLDDMLALAVIGREVKTGLWLHWAHAWLHPIALERRKSEVSRYRDFEADGDLTIVEKIGDDVEQLADYVKRVDSTGLLERIGVDQAAIESIVEAIWQRKVKREINSADRIVAIPQGWKMMSSIQNTERKLAEAMMVHGGSRLMAYCVANAKVEPRGNAIMITKQVAGKGKIDPLMATFNSAALMSLNPAPTRKKIHMFTVGG